jgi:hypothetical protein
MRLHPVTVLAGVIALFHVSTAWAEPPGKVQLWIDTVGSDCAAHRTALARELTLACDAGGALCALASTEADADRRIVLHCDESAWSLEGREPSGAPLWRVELAGGDTDRLRSAAVFAVRAEGARPAPSAAPEPAKHDDAGGVEVAPSTPATEADAVPKPKGSGTFSLAAAPRASTVIGHGRSTGLVGIGAYAVMKTFRDVRVGVSASVDHDNRRDTNLLPVDDRMPEASRTNWLAGAVIGMGAPFERTPLGVLVEANYGLATFSSRRFSECTVVDNEQQCNGPLVSGSSSIGQVRGSVVYQLLTASTIRPWVALSVRHLWNNQTNFGSDTSTLAGLDLGVVWDP